MFKKLYAAGRAFTQNRLPQYVPGQDMPTQDKTEAAGILGVGLGQALQNMGLFGMVGTLALAVVTGMTAATGLPVVALAAYGLIGTGFAGLGTFGKGMKDAGEEASGVLQLARDFRREAFKEITGGIKNKLFKPGAKPAAESFATAAAPASDEPKLPAVTPATSALPQSSPLEMK